MGLPRRGRWTRSSKRVVKLLKQARRWRITQQSETTKLFLHLARLGAAYGDLVWLCQIPTRSVGTATPLSHLGVGKWLHIVGICSGPRTGGARTKYVAGRCRILLDYSGWTPNRVKIKVVIFTAKIFWILAFGFWCYWVFGGRDDCS